MQILEIRYCVGVYKKDALKVSLEGPINEGFYLKPNFEWLFLFNFVYSDCLI